MLKKTFELIFHSNHAFRSAAERIRLRLSLARQGGRFSASEEKTLDLDRRMLDSWFSEL